MSPDNDSIVYVTGGHNAPGGPTIHTDDQCYTIRDSSLLRARPRDVYPDDVNICDVCSGDIEHGTPDKSAYNALKNAAQDGVDLDGHS